MLIILSGAIVRSEDISTKQGLIKFFNLGQAKRKIEARKRDDGEWQFEQKHHDGSVLIVTKKGEEVEAKAVDYNKLLAQAV